MKRRIVVLMGAFLAVAVGVGAWSIAQPPMRTHTITHKGVLRPLAANSQPTVESQVSIEVVGDQRIIRANGIPNHKTGRFPNAGNPNRISAQRHVYRIPANPVAADRATPMRGEFGIAVNGVPFDPGAAEFYAGDPGWQYEPLSGAITLGIDVSHAHVQPTGKYHYHGLPTGLLDSVKLESTRHSPLIGWAADGFPIYAVYGYAKASDEGSSIKALTSSYQLKKGNRPGGNAPGGKYDGTFVRDYEYVPGSGDLDECNGRFTVTPDFPDGTYAYFLTEDWPVIPRSYRGTPSDDFRHGPGPGRFTGGSQGRQSRNQGPPGFHDESNGPGQFHGPGQHGGPGGPRPGELLPPFAREALRLSEKQVAELEALQKEVDDRLSGILSEKQQSMLRGGRSHRGPR